jgi:hypothetical protein
MSQFPHDRFNKNLFELRLSPFGDVSIQRPLDPETTFLDIYFVPHQPIAAEPQLSLLAQCISDQRETGSIALFRTTWLSRLITIGI